jgi:hypothetical protein
MEIIMNNLWRVLPWIILGLAIFFSLLYFALSKVRFNWEKEGRYTLAKLRRYLRRGFWRGCVTYKGVSGEVSFRLWVFDENIRITFYSDEVNRTEKISVSDLLVRLAAFEGTVNADVALRGISF